MLAITILKGNQENSLIYNSIKNNKLHSNKFNLGDVRLLHKNYRVLLKEIKEDLNN